MVVEHFVYKVYLVPGISFDQILRVEPDEKEP